MNNLCLDIGNVICKIDFNDFYRLLSSRLNLSHAEVDGFLNRVQKLHDLGLTSLADELKDHFKIKSEVIIDDLLNSWNCVLTPNVFIINKINDFININNVNLALLSNIGLEHSKLIDHVFTKLSLNYSVKHFSCDVGARKPSLIYYQSFLMQHPEYKNSIYVDDNNDNLATGNKMGFKTVYFNLDDNDKTQPTSDILLADTLIKRIKEASEN